MGKVKYNKKYKYYERKILINGHPITVIGNIKKHLEKLPYRLNSNIRIKTDNKRSKR